jgi:hypothetical protein
MAGLVPAIPMRRSAAPHTIGITGTRPVMTSENKHRNIEQQKSPAEAGLFAFRPK